MPKFCVISYDDDQQQTFTDFVEAINSDAAKELVESARSYATAVDALQAGDLREIAGNLQRSKLCSPIRGIKLTEGDATFYNHRFDMMIDMGESAGLVCRKCGAGMEIEAAVFDVGTGKEAGNIFEYCSTECKEAH